MIYYGQPTAWGETVEEDIIASVIRLLGRLEALPGP